MSKWKVVLRLPRFRENPSQVERLGKSLSLACSAAEISIKGKELLKRLLRIAAGESPSFVFPSSSSGPVNISQIGCAEMPGLTSCTFFPNLTSLDVSENKLGLAEMQVLASSSSFSNLTSLNVKDTCIRYAGMQALAALFQA